MNEQRKWTIVLMTITVFVTTAAFLPGLVHAGNLEPSAPPDPTMHTLDEIYQKLEQLAPDGLVRAGNLEPSDLPGPTMHTLDEIYQKLEQLASGGLVPVPKTGQTMLMPDVTGEDGELQKGVAWPDPRFTDNGDGTVTDNLTGLIWLKDANCFGERTWTQALSDCNNLANGSCGLTDGSSAGDWRLPNVRELHSLIDYGQYSPTLPDGHPFTNVQSSYYWSSSTVAYNTSGAWGVGFYSGGVSGSDKGGVSHVWCVRGGQ